MKRLNDIFLYDTLVSDHMSKMDRCVWFKFDSMVFNTLYFTVDNGIEQPKMMSVYLNDYLETKSNMLKRLA